VSVDEWVKLITVFSAFISPIILAYISYLGLKAKGAVNDVKTTLATTNSDTTTKLDDIHTLVNSRLTEALSKIDRLEQRLYQVTGELPTGEPSVEKE
jgi:hypothetical protein